MEFELFVFLLLFLVPVLASSRWTPHLLMKACRPWNIVCDPNKRLDKETKEFLTSHVSNNLENSTINLRVVVIDQVWSEYVSWNDQSLSKALDATAYYLRAFWKQQTNQSNFVIILVSVEDQHVSASFCPKTKFRQCAAEEILKRREGLKEILEDFVLELRGQGVVCLWAVWKIVLVVLGSAIFAFLLSVLGFFLFRDCGADCDRQKRKKLKQEDHAVFYGSIKNDPDDFVDEAKPPETM